MSAVLITGATGKQGGAVIKTLLSKRAGFEILAVTRNARSPAAQKLSHMSSTIKLVEGNLDDPAGIFRTARSVTSAPIWGVFSVQVSAEEQLQHQPCSSFVRISSTYNADGAPSR